MVGGVCLYMRKLSSYFGVDEGEGFVLLVGKPAERKGEGLLALALQLHMPRGACSEHAQVLY